MSLKKCSECENTISTKAKTCPHCGAKNKKSRRGILVLIILAAVACAIILPLLRGISEETKTSVENTVKEGLRSLGIYISGFLDGQEYTDLYIWPIVQLAA